MSYCLLWVGYSAATTPAAANAAGALWNDPSFMGTRQLVTVDTDAGRVRVRAPNTVKVNDGETVGLSFSSPDLVVFDGVTGAALQSDLYAGGGDG